MRDNLTWRRCATCGQLTLVPAAAEACWQCGAPIAAQPAAGATRPPLGRPAAPTRADLNLPAPPPRFLDLTPDDDLVARRLLASVFPEGVEL